MTKATLIRSAGKVILFSGLFFALFCACEKNDIRVNDADVSGGTTTTSSTSATTTTATSTTGTSTTGTSTTGTSTTGTSTTGTSTTGSTTGSPCTPPVNSATFTGTTSFTLFSGMTGVPITQNGYYALYASVTVGGYLRTMRVVLPSASAPTSSGTYTMDYNFWTVSNPTLASNKCAVRFYQSNSGGYNAGYGFSGTVYVVKSGTLITATFCNASFYNYINGSTYAGSFTATGKVDN
jgi:hypothetical protein